MGDATSLLKALIDGIWLQLSSCCRTPFTFIESGAMECDAGWKQRQAYNAFLLQHYVSETPTMYSNIKELANKWTINLLFVMLRESAIDTDQGKESLVPVLTAFNKEIEDAIAAWQRVGILDEEINGLINEIWEGFKDCISIDERPKADYLEINISTDVHWKQTMHDNVLTLDRYWNELGFINSKRATQRDRWVNSLIPFIVSDPKMDTIQGKNFILTELCEFTVQLRPLMVDQCMSCIPIETQQLNAAIDRLSNLYDQIYPTT